MRILGVLVVCFAVGVAGAQAPCKPTITGHVDIFPMESKVFHKTRNLRVWLPPGYDVAENAMRKYKVLYLLDAQAMFDACTAFMHEEMHADETLTELITAGKVEPIVVVGVDNGKLPVGDKGEQRPREYLPYPDATNPAAHDVSGDDFVKFMERDVMPVVEAKYRVKNGAENTALGGSSYGGVATFYALIRRPDLFDMGIVESPSTQIGNGAMMRDSEHLVYAPSKVVMGVGAIEWAADGDPQAAEHNAAYVKSVTLLAEHLRAASEQPSDVRLTVQPDGKHNQTSFGSRFGAALLFLFPAKKSAA